MPIRDRLRDALARIDGVVAAAWAFALVPIVVATARALDRGWLPIGDNAIVAVRARDVATSHHPLLGTWSSASLDAGTDLNHPGPLLFDALAPFTRVFGTSAGVAIGAAFVNVIAVTLVAAFARRRAGRAGALLALFAVLALEFTMGSELLFDPWNPHVLILPCLALFFAAWSIAEGDQWGLPAYVALGSFLVQTHLGYSYLVPLTLGAAVLAGVVGQQRAVIALWPRRRALVTSAVIAAVLWVQPVWEQLTSDGEGNLSRILGARDNAGAKLGGSLAVRGLAGVATAPPWSWRHAFMHALPPTPYESPGVLGLVDTMGVGAALLRLGMLAAIIGCVLYLAWRRRDRAGFTAVALSALCLVVALGTLAITPIGPVGLTSHQVRWLWPLTTFTWFAVGLAAARAWSRSSTWTTVRRPLLGVVGAAILVLSVATLPTYTQGAGLAPFAATQVPVLDDLDDQLGALDDVGTVWFDETGLPLYDNYAAGVLAELQRRGVPFVVDDPGLVRQYGDDRRYDGTNADVHVVMRWGESALTVPDGYDVVALVVPDDDPARAVGVFSAPID